MERGKSVGLRVLAMLALAAFPELACCHLAERALPPIIVCASEGRLPDPTDCSSYMDCKSNTDGSFTQTITPCPAGTYYNSCQGDCSITQQPSPCSVTCDTSPTGNMIVSGDNKSVYFICVLNDTRLYINVAMCENGNAVDGLSSCNGDPTNCPVNNQTPSSVCTGTYYYGDENNCSVYYYCSGNGASPDHGFCDTDQYFIAYNHSCVEFQCSSVGTFADPASCSGYYYCAGDGSDDKTHMECPSGSHFDSSVGGCMPGVCTTICPEVGGAFTCTSSGYFADPLNCSSYYYCDSSLQPKHYVCPPRSHFDSVVGGCMTGECTNRLVDIGPEVGLRSLRSVSSFSSQHQEAHITFWSARKESQVPSP